MKASVTFTLDIDHIPATCRECKFATLCDQMLNGITKRGGMEWTASARRCRHKKCPLKVEHE